MRQGNNLTSQGVNRVGRKSHDNRICQQSREAVIHQVQSPFREMGPEAGKAKSPRSVQGVGLEMRQTSTPTASFRQRVGAQSLWGWKVWVWISGKTVQGD